MFINFNCIFFLLSEHKIKTGILFINCYTKMNIYYNKRPSKNNNFYK